VVAFEVVVGHELVGVALDLLDGQIEILATIHLEALVEQGPVHPQLDEAVGARAPDLGIAVLDIFDGQQPFIAWKCDCGLPLVQARDLRRHTRPRGRVCIPRFPASGGK